MIGKTIFCRLQRRPLSREIWAYSECCLGSEELKYHKLRSSHHKAALQRRASRRPRLVVHRTVSIKYVQVEVTWTSQSCATLISVFLETCLFDDPLPPLTSSISRLGPQVSTQRVTNTWTRRATNQILLTLSFRMESWPQIQRECWTQKELYSWDLLRPLHPLLCLVALLLSSARLP